MSRLSVVMIHNRYRQAGGEDEVFEAEARLLESRGHRVSRVMFDNRDLAGSPLSLAARTVWNHRASRQVRDACRESGAAVAHFHNTFPMISPAGYYAARAEGAAVVQTLHNFRLVCPNALCFRGGRVCEDCVTRAVPWPAVMHRCYRGSAAASTATAVMLTLHRAAGTWDSKVDRYVALSRFARSRFAAGGLPEARLALKPNFLAADPGCGNHRGGYALFVGRLSAEKGITPMLRAWSALPSRIPLKVVGGGPLEPQVRGAGPGVEWLGVRTQAQVTDLMRDAAFLVFPSEVYENCPLTLIQALATGLPVVASGHGSIAEMVPDGVVGSHFRPGDPDDLARVVGRAIEQPQAMAAMGMAARAAYEERYTADRNYDVVAGIYRDAIAHLGRAA